jgi:hypothetical protein
MDKIDIIERVRINGKHLSIIDKSRLKKKHWILIKSY